MTPEQRLQDLGIELPVLEPLAGPLLKRVVVRGDLAFVSGDGDDTVTGYVGGDVSVEQAAAAAKTIAYRHCAALRDELGTLDRVERFVKTLVLVRSAPGFTAQPTVANGYSAAVAELWGDERGLCARSAIGVAELPFGIAVEIEAVVAIVPY